MYGEFVKACRAVGITVPIVPGIMCLNSAAGFVKMAAFCKTRVPDELRRRMEAVKESPEEVKAYGIEFGAQMSKRLLELGAPGLHYYSLNLEIVVMGILDNLGLRTQLPPAPPAATTAAAPPAAAN